MSHGDLSSLLAYIDLMFALNSPWTTVTKKESPLQVTLDKLVGCKMYTYIMHVVDNSVGAFILCRPEQQT